MSAQDNIEKVLRGLHVLLSKSEPYGREPSKVIVDKQEVLDLLAELNKCVYGIMDEYEMTKQSRDRAEREFKKRGDDIIWDASRKAEDIYAASVMYTDEALSRVQEIVKQANSSVEEIYAQMNQKLEEQEKLCRTNQLELKSQLQNLVDTEKYLKIIEERNKERQKEKEKGNPTHASETSLYANRQTEIKVNQEYLEKMGLSVDEVSETKESEMVEADIKIDLDADYFRWKEEQQEEVKEKNTKEKPERFQNVFKNFTSGKR